MTQRSQFLKAFFAIALVPLIGMAGCTDNSTTSPTTNAPSGTLYYSTTTSVLGAAATYSLDLKTGVLTNLVPGVSPYRTAEGTIICINNDGLVEYNAAGTSARMIVKQERQAPMAETYDDDFYNPQVSQDGKYIAYEGHAHNKDDFYIVDRYTGKLIFSFIPDDYNNGYGSPSWTPDNRIVVRGGTANPGLYISSADWKTYTRFDPQLIAPTLPIVSPDGKTVAFVMNAHLWTIGIDGTGLKQITTSDLSETLPTWSPDGKWIGILGKSSLLLLPMGEAGLVNVRNINSNSATYIDTQFSWR